MLFRSVSLDKMETLMCKLDLNNLIQCTGLKDKNGKLIYEGDVVRINNKDIYIVEWLSTYSQFHIEDYGVLDITLSSTYEVIGNIYENSELLNDNLKRAENLITNPESKILDSIKRAKIKTDIGKAIEELFDNE